MSYAADNLVSYHLTKEAKCLTPPAPSVVPTLKARAKPATHAALYGFPFLFSRRNLLITCLHGRPALSKFHNDTIPVSDHRWLRFSSEGNVHYR